MSALTQITTRAKVIRRSQGGSWKSALKKAGAEFRNKSKKVGAVKIIEKKEKRSTRPDRIVRVTRKKDGSFKKFSQVGGFDKLTVVRQISDTVSFMENNEKQIALLKQYIRNSKRDPKGHPKNPNEIIQLRYLRRLQNQKKKQLSDLKRLL